MTDPTPNERVNSAADLAAAARDSTMEKLEGAKGHLAEGAERLAAAVDRTADNLAAEGDDTVSGFGRSLSGLMRQLAGGLRERDIEQFARELGTMARRNPGVFLAGSVALGFGVARFFKARPPRAQSDYVRGDWQDADAASADTIDDDTQESLDLSETSSGVAGWIDGDNAAPSSARQSGPQPFASQTDDGGSTTPRSGNKETSQQKRATSADAPSDVDANASNGRSAERPMPGGKGS